MKLQRILALAAAMTLSLAAHAHDCSGGSAGGMDATGNQCNDGAYVATSTAASPLTTATSNPSTHATMSKPDHKPTRVASNGHGSRSKAGQHGTKHHPAVG